MPTMMRITLGAIMIAVFSMLALVYSVRQRPLETATNLPQRSPSVIVAPAEAIPSATATASAPQPTPTARVELTRSAKIGDSLQTKNWKLAVSSTDHPGKILIWNEFGSKSEALGVWFVVNLSLTNIGGENFAVHNHDFELRDATGFRYAVSECFCTYSSFKKQVSLGKQMPPNIEVSTPLLFDIAPNAAGLVLTFKQEGGRSWSVE